MGCGSSTAVGVSEGMVDAHHGGFLERARRKRNQDKPHGYLVNWIDSLEESNKEMVAMLGRWAAEAEEFELFAKDVLDMPDEDVRNFSDAFSRHHKAAVGAQAAAVEVRIQAKTMLDELLKLMRAADDKKAAREQADRALATAEARLSKAKVKRDKIMNSDTTVDQRQKVTTDVNEHEHGVKVAAERQRLRLEEETEAQKQVASRRRTDICKVLVDLTASQERALAQAYEEYKSLRLAAQALNGGTPVNEPSSNDKAGYALNSGTASHTTLTVSEEDNKRESSATATTEPITAVSDSNSTDAVTTPDAAVTTPDAVVTTPDGDEAGDEPQDRTKPEENALDF